MFIERLLFIIFVSLFIAHNLYADFDFGNKFVEVREAAIKMSADSRSSINEMKNKVSKKSPISNKSSKRVALVIGNKNYSSQTQLKNPINDAKLIKKTLESLDFKVLEAYDADIEKLDESINVFISESRKADVALIYYAGHGIGVEGRNYLVPLGTNNLSKSNLSRKLISLSELQDSVSKAKHFGVVLFDACRNSFFRQNIEGIGNARASRALVRPTVRHTSNILVSFSTEAGTIAKDDIDGGEHSPYALALSEKLKESKDIRLVMGGVKDRVLQLTDYQQEPIDRSSLGGDTFYLYKKERPSYSATVASLENNKVEVPKLIPLKVKKENITTLGNLMWQDISIEKTKNMNWEDAISYCQNLTLGNYKDWTMPTKDELQGLCSQRNKLSNVPDEKYWSSTPATKKADNAWSIYGTEKIFSCTAKNDNMKHAYNSVRCVRRTSVDKSPFFLIIKPNPAHADIEITNITEQYVSAIALKKGLYNVKISAGGYKTKSFSVNLTQDTTYDIVLEQDKIKNMSKKHIRTIKQYMWQDEQYTQKEKRAYGKTEDSIGKVLNHGDAVKYCENLTLGGYRDWALPSRKELQDLYKNKSKLKYFVPAIFWSSSTNTPASFSAYGIDFYKGSVGGNYDFIQRYVRCIRSK